MNQTPGTAVTRTEPEAGAVTEKEEITKTASLLQTQWGGSTQMTLDDFKAIALICRSSGMDPVFDMDILGGKPYDKADFWKGMLAGHPDVVDYKLEALRFGTPEWDEWIGVTDPDVVAAAYLATVTMGTRALPIQEANYVKKSDPILTSYTEPVWFNGPKADVESANYVAELINDDVDQADIDRFPTKNGFGVKIRQIAEDWQALSKKKARTTVFRRVGKQCIPREHARVMRAMSEIQTHMENVEASQSAKAHVVSADDPYTTEEVPVEVGGGSQIIPERERRKLLAEAEKKGLDINGVKIEVAKMLGIPIEDADTVTTSKITFDTYERMMILLDSLSEPVYEIEVEAEEQQEPVQEPVQEPGDGSPTYFLPGE